MATGNISMITQLIQQDMAAMDYLSVGPGYPGLQSMGSLKETLSVHEQIVWYASIHLVLRCAF